jgi:hypothetical protein
MLGRLFCHRSHVSRTSGEGCGSRLRTASLGLTVLVALWAATLSVPATANTSGHALEGTWRVTVSVGGGTFDALYTFGGDGTLIESDQDGFRGQGTWTKTGSGEYAFTWDSFVPAQFAPFVRLKIRGVVSLNNDDSYTAVTQYEFLDALGNVLASGCGSEVGTRMRVEPVTACPVSAGLEAPR